MITPLRSFTLYLSLNSIVLFCTIPYHLLMIRRIRTNNSILLLLIFTMIIIGISILWPVLSQRTQQTRQPSLLRSIPSHQSIHQTHHSVHQLRIIHNIRSSNLSLHPPSFTYSEPWDSASYHWRTCFLIADLKPSHVAPDSLTTNWSYSGYY